MDWSERPPRLEGEIVRLEPLRDAHLEPIFEASQDPRVWEWLFGRDVVPTRERMEAWVHDALQAAAAHQAIPFATVSVASGKVIGSSRLMSLRPEHRGMEIGWTWLNPIAWRTGANVEAKLLMLDYAFGQLGAIRVEFKTDARNERSRNALAAIPAKFEGIFRNHMLSPYGRRDSAYYSVIDDDWPAVREQLKQRLDSVG